MQKKAAEAAVTLWFFGGEMKQQAITIRVDARDFRRLVERADSKNLTVSGLVKIFVVDALSEQDRIDQLHHLESSIERAADRVIAKMLELADPSEEQS